jgi:hypothetical protein
MLCNGTRVLVKYINNIKNGDAGDTIQVGILLECYPYSLQFEGIKFKLLIKKRTKKSLNQTGPK